MMNKPNVAVDVIFHYDLRSPMDPSSFSSTSTTKYSRGTNSSHPCVENFEESMSDVDLLSDEESHRTSEDPRSQPITSWLWKKDVLWTIFLQAANIALWYYTNGMNGIAMQAFAKQLQQQHDTQSSQQQQQNFPSARQYWHILPTTCLVTFQQLLIGAAIGRIVLYLLNPTITWQRIRSSHWIPLSFLHALGSLATNIGFMYGKASVIQVIKLLEPFETLLLSHFLFQEGTFTSGTICSMIVVVGGATSLLRLQSTPPAPQAILAALASGLLLSSRNVLQRKHHATKQQQQPSSKQQQQQQPQSDNPISRELSKLEKSIVQFTQLSFFSGLFVSTMWIMLRCSEQTFNISQSVGTAVMTMGSANSTTTDAFLYDNARPSLQVFLWHPLYNIFSMITLGFCTALTHSLLNAGKRVFAICMAMIWFQEGLNDPAKIAGLVVVGLGGCWYSAERKCAKEKK